MAKILLIDESPWIMAHMKKVLERKGHEVYVANDGVKGLNLAEKERPDLVMTDIMLPQKDGFEIVLQIRKKFPFIKMIATTSERIAHADHYLKAIKHFGVELTIKKPFRDRYLTSAVDSILGISA
jgi:CheY-like chemotaxis protein